MDQHHSGCGRQLRAEPGASPVEKRQHEYVVRHNHHVSPLEPPSVITQTLEYADLNLVRQYWDQENAYFTSTIGQANSADIVMAYKQSTTSLERYALSYNAYASEMVSVMNNPAYTNNAFVSLTSISLNHDGNTIYSANSTSEWASFDGTTYTDNGLLHTNANVQTINTISDTEDNSYFYRFDQTQGMVLTKYNAAQVELWSELIIADSPKQHYFLPEYQRVIIYDASTSTLKLRSHQ